MDVTEFQGIIACGALGTLIGLAISIFSKLCKISRQLEFFIIFIIEFQQDQLNRRNQ